MRRRPLFHTYHMKPSPGGSYLYIKYIYYIFKINTNVSNESDRVDELYRGFSTVPRE